MTVRREIAEPPRETGARSREDPMRTRAVRGGFEGRARRPKARRSSGSAIAAETLMNNAGEEGISEGFRLAKSERAVPGGVGAEGPCHPVSAAGFFMIRTMRYVRLLSWFWATFPELYCSIP